MNDSTTTVATLKEILFRFAEARQWNRFHTPKNLCMALACEVGELLEHFLWVDGPESRTVLNDAAVREAVADELADVAGLLLQLSIQTGIDLSAAIVAKVAKNERKYPIESS